MDIYFMLYLTSFINFHKFCFLCFTQQPSFFGNVAVVILLTIFAVSNINVFCVCVSDCEDKGVNSGRLVACITTLYLFSKIRAQLMVKHAMTMQPYLTTKCNVSTI